MAKFFSADLHVGEGPTPGTPTYYRWGPPEAFQRHFLDLCHKQISKNDDLYLIGDLVCSVQDIKFYDQLPDCRLHIVCGNKEKRIENFADETFKRLSSRRNRMEIIAETLVIETNDRIWRLIHRPEDILKYPVLLPTLCGHEHGFWRTKKLPNGEPIINVGIDAWGNLVSEEFIELQHQGVKSGKFDRFMDPFCAKF